MRISFEELRNQFERVLLKYSFPPHKASLCARIFAENSRDGVYSHGLNRFPVFIKMVKDGYVDANAEPEVINYGGALEQWDGHLAPGMYTATKAMERAIELAKENRLGAVAVRNSNHWMRGGTYGWQAANEGYIGICMTNTISNMPPWGGKEPRIGNNPLIIAIPHADGHVVLDMAMSQYSYGKLQEYELRGQDLPISGGYNEKGEITTDPGAIRASKRVLPIGFWKGSGLALVIDMLVTVMSGGRSTAQVTADQQEYGLSQFFLCIDPLHLENDKIDEIIAYTKSSSLAENSGSVSYPGENTIRLRNENLLKGIPVHEEIWQQILSL